MSPRAISSNTMEAIAAHPSFPANRRKTRFLRLDLAVLRIHVGIVEIGKAGPRRPAGLQGIPQHDGKLFFPEFAVRGQAGRKVDDPAAFNCLCRLPCIQQVRRHERIVFVDLAGIAAHKPQRPRMMLI